MSTSGPSGPLVLKCMHFLQACLFNYITVAAFSIYAQHGEDVAKRVGWRRCIKYLLDNHKSGLLT